MIFRSKQHITKSNGFSLPLSRGFGHPHVEVLVSQWIADEKRSDLFVKLRICHVLSSYSSASADTHASFADAVNVAALGWRFG